jgi:hypothetical protein
LLRDEENASLKKGLEFLLGRLVPASCSLDERRHHAQVCDSINSRDGPRELTGSSALYSFFEPRSRQITHRAPPARHLRGEQVGYEVLVCSSLVRGSADRTTSLASWMSNEKVRLLTSQRSLATRNAVWDDHLPRDILFESCRLVWKKESANYALTPSQRKTQKI